MKYLKIVIALLILSVFAPRITSSAMVPKINPCYMIKATYYCPNECCNGMWAGFATTGKKLEYGVVAIDPKYWEMGQKFKIKALDKEMVFSAEDTGSAIKGKCRMDICFNTHSEALSGHPEQVIVEVIN